MTINTLLLIFAFVSFVAASAGFDSFGRVNLVPLGLALWVLAMLV